MDDKLWKYLREGISYLETSSKPEAVSPSFQHPDNPPTYGAYGLSENAFKTVQNLNPEMKKISFNQVLESPDLYDKVSMLYADWMYKALDKELSGKSPESVFDAIQQSWNLGLGGYKKGRKPAESRMTRAKEWKEGKAKWRK